MKRGSIFAIALGIAAALIALVAYVSSRKSGPTNAAVQPPGAQTAPDRGVPAGLQPGIEFFDAAKQHRYETFFNDSLALFQPPVRGNHIWLRRWDGRLTGGTVEDLSADTLLLLTARGLESITLTDMSMESRARIFPGEFARAHAMARMTSEAAAPAAAGAEQVRYVMADDIPVRIGPGGEYKINPEVHIAGGQAVTVLEERNGWLRIQNPSASPCWVSRFLTYPLQEMDSATLPQGVEQLNNMGLIAGVDAEQNTIDVDPEIWNGTDPQMRMGVARTLAAWCALARKNNLAFVTIRDNSTKRKLGKYSQGQGWKDLTL